MAEARDLPGRKVTVYFSNLGRAEANLRALAVAAFNGCDARRRSGAMSREGARAGMEGQ